ncbi:MAG: kelch repeat-containing protein [Caldilineaceae bacterium]
MPRRGVALVAVADRLFAIGGYSAETGFTNVVEMYDPTEDRWIAQRWSLTPRTWAAATAFAAGNDEIIVIAGGYNLEGVLDLVERVDITTGHVCHPPPLPMGRAWFAVVPTTSGLLAVGGETATGFTGTVEVIATKCE